MIMLKQKELKVIRLNGEVYYHNFNELDLTVNEMCDKQKLREKGIKVIELNNNFFSSLDLSLIKQSIIKIKKIEQVNRALDEFKDIIKQMPQIISGYLDNLEEIKQSREELVEWLLANDKEGQEIGFITPKNIDLDSIISLSMAINFINSLGLKSKINYDYLIMVSYDIEGQILISSKAKENYKDILWVGLDCDYWHKDLNSKCCHNHLSIFDFGANRNISLGNKEMFKERLTPVRYIGNRRGIGTALVFLTEETPSKYIDLALMSDSSLYALMSQYRNNKILKQVPLTEETKFVLDNWSDYHNYYRNYLVKQIKALKFDNNNKIIEQNKYINTKEEHWQVIENFINYINSKDFEPFENVYKLNFSFSKSDKLDKPIKYFDEVIGSLIDLERCEIYASNIWQEHKNSDLMILYCHVREI